MWQLLLQRGWRWLLSHLRKGVWMWGRTCILNRYGLLLVLQNYPEGMIFIRGPWKETFFFFVIVFVFPLERWGSNIKGHFYIVNLFMDSPFAFILEKYVLCQWVAILPSISACLLLTQRRATWRLPGGPTVLMYKHSQSSFQDSISSLLQFPGWWGH